MTPDAPAPDAPAPDAPDPDAPAPDASAHPDSSHPDVLPHAAFPADLAVGRLCLGGNVFGWTADEQQSFAVLDAFVAAGGSFVDTADVYSAWAPGHRGGESERVLGRWLASRGNRDAMVIATKVGSFPGLTGLSATTVAAAAQASLERLQTDHIDLYYAHRDDPATPAAETMGAFDVLVRAGTVRYVAGSNYTAPRLAEALAASDAGGLARYVALQPKYNLLERDYEDDLAPLLAREGLACLPYATLASGFLTGKYRAGAVVDSPRAPGVEKYGNERGEAVLAAVEQVADGHGTTMAAVALAWLLAQPTVTAPLASARTVQQLKAILPGQHLRLGREELELLSAAGEVG